MNKIDFIFSTLMHYVCAIAIGIFLYAGSETAFTFKMILIMVILLIASWFYYIIAIKSARKPRAKIIPLTLESEKPDDMPDEVWEKMQELMQVTNIILEKENEDNGNDEG